VCLQVAEGLLQRQAINVIDVNGDHAPRYYDVLVYREAAGWLIVLAYRELSRGPGECEFAAI
jgi:hypothetical protein